VTFLAVLLLVAYAAANVFGAWAVLRRRSGAAQGFMAAAAALVVAAVAVGFGHPAALPFTIVGALLASWVSLADVRWRRDRVVPWRHHGLRALVGISAVAAVLLALR
jgi:hypothetical protein